MNVGKIDIAQLRGVSDKGTLEQSQRAAQRAKEAS